MTVIIKKSALSVASAMVLGASAASAVTVVNGNFEEGAGYAGINGGQLFETLVAGPASSWNIFTTLPGWTSVLGAGIEVKIDRTLPTTDAQEGDHYVELDSDLPLFFHPAATGAGS